MVVVLTIVLWLAFVALGVMLARLARHREEPEPQPALPAVADRRPTVRGVGQVLFAESDGRTLRVDCALVGANTQGAAPGSLLAFRLYPPKVPMRAAPFEALLSRWADEVRVVDLELRPCADGWRLRLDDGDLCLNLEICQPARVA